MRERIPLEALELQGSPNLLRSIKREEQEKNAPALDDATKSEIEKLDGLIAQAMKGCRRGHTFRGKPNPAFDHLSKLIKARDLLLRGKARTTKTADTLANVSEFFRKAGVS